MPKDQNESIAFFYRMQEREPIIKKILEDARKYISEFTSRILNPLINDEEDQPNSTPREATAIIEKFFSDEDVNGNTNFIYVLADLNKIKDSLIQLIQNQPPESPLSTSVIEKWNDSIWETVEQLVKKTDNQMKTYAYQRGSEKYFKNYFLKEGQEKEDFTTLRDTGKLYCPPGGKHSWEANLDWLLKRIQNGTKFIIMSKVSEESRKRSVDPGDSGFSREIATCFKIGYRFEKKGDEIVMKHPNISYLQSIDRTSLEMTAEEGEKKFLEAVQTYQALLDTSQSHSPLDEFGHAVTEWSSFPPTDTTYEPTTSTKSHEEPQHSDSSREPSSDSPPTKQPRTEKILPQEEKPRDSCSRSPSPNRLS